MDTDKLEQTKLEEHVFSTYPYPVASAWYRVFAVESASEKLAQIHAVLEIVPRYLLSILLQEYRRGPRDLGLESKLLSGLQRPSIGGWWEATRTLLQHSRDRSLPRPWAALAPAWYFTPTGKPTAVQHTVTRLIEQRNLLHLTPPVSSTAQGNSLVEALRGTRELLASLDWLEAYPLVRVLSQEPTSSGASGSVQRLRGAQWPPLSEVASWQGTLLNGAVYLVHPESGALLLDPFLRVGETPSTKTERPRLFKRLANNGAIEDADDELAPAPAKQPPGGVPRTLAAFFESGVMPSSPLASLRWTSEKTNLTEEQFTLIEEIGRGGFGVVFAARDRTTGRVVAVKRLRPEFAANQAIRRRFYAEGDRFFQVTHTHLLPGAMHLSRSGEPLLVMRRMACSLAARISPPGLDEQQTLALAAALLSALAHLHAKGILHGDIKPENILLDEHGKPYLADLGLSRDEAEDTPSSVAQIVGTPGYMAPEQRQGRPERASDVFALGVTLLEVASGTRPASQTPGGFLGELLVAMRHPDPRQRLSSSHAMRLLQEHLIRGGSVVAEPEDAALPDDARALGRRLREVFERCETPRAELHDRLAAAKHGEKTALSLWHELRRRHLRVSWIHHVERLTVGDIALDAGLRFSRPALDARLRKLPLAPEQRKAFSRQSIDSNEGQTEAVYRQIPAGALGLATLVDCLGTAQAAPLRETEFLEEALRALGISWEGTVEQMWWLLAMTLGLIDPVFRRRAMRKTDGSVRWIHRPTPNALVVLRLLARKLSDYFPFRHQATAFAAQRSTALQARYHQGAVVALSVDIHDFFGSITVEHVAVALGLVDSTPDEIAIDAGQRVQPFARWSRVSRVVLRRLLFVRERTRVREFLPQGSPVSPLLANIAGHALDAEVRARLERTHYAQHWIYSRYADDLVLSSVFPDAQFFPKARAILLGAIKQMNWCPSPRKIRPWSAARGKPLTVCGIHVPPDEGELRLPREEARRLRAALDTTKQGDVSRAARGLLAYAYAATGRHDLVVALPGKTRGLLQELARALVGQRAPEFLAGWVERRQKP